MSETAGKAAAPKGIGARISQDDIARVRQQIGIPQYERNDVFNRAASADTISHFAFGIGDDNPLWHDPEHGKRSRWRSQIGSPLYPTTLGIDETPPPTPELKQLFRGLFRGVGKYYSGSRWEFYKPVCPGDRLYRQYTTIGIDVKENSNFSGGITVIDTYRYFYVNHLGDPVAVHEKWFVNAERGATREKGTLAKQERARYTKEDIERIDAVYEAEQVRGAEPRYWEDVAEGEKLVPLAKGPLRVTDIVGFHVGWGMGQDYGAGPLRYGWKQRKRMPGFYVDDPFGVPDIAQRMHWDPSWAEAIGLPAPYDYGAMRTNWLGHLVTNWMGDDAWMTRLNTDLRGFNFVGDTSICTGEVVAKSVEGLHHLVELKLEMTNQRGEVTTRGTAQVALPTRGAAVVLPQPRDELRQGGADMVLGGALRLRG